MCNVQKVSCNAVSTSRPFLCNVALPHFPSEWWCRRQGGIGKAVASYEHVAYLLVCAAKLVVPLFNNLQCSVPELAGNTGWARQRLLGPEPQAEFKKVCEVSSQLSTESSAALEELVDKIYHM